jgi:hypothetical protein
MPAVHSNQTRNNVHAVFYTLAYTGLTGVQEEATTPEIEFHNDDFQYDTYFADRSGTMMSSDTRADGNMGELAEKLEDLDDFFDDPPKQSSMPLDSTSRHSSGHPEERARVYNEETVPILQQSLERNQSSTSFQSGFASSEVRYPAVHKPVVMNPAAFAQHAIRPSMHSRSITTPAAVKRSPPRLQNDLMSGDEAGDEPEPFSDDDLSIERANTADEPQVPMHNGKAAGNTLRGWKQGLRRLTSSGGSRQDAIKSVTSAPAKSPKVPKVPQTFYHGPLSAEP